MVRLKAERGSWLKFACLRMLGLTLFLCNEDLRHDVSAASRLICCFRLIRSIYSFSSIRSPNLFFFVSISLSLTLYPSLLFLSVPDIFVGSEGARLITGLLGFEEGLQTQEPGDCARAEERGVHQTGESAQEGERDPDM